MIRELTCGTLGNLVWFNWCFNVSLDEAHLIIKVPFYKKVIPVARIRKLESIKGFLQPKHLKLTYDNGAQPTKFIRFFSVNPSSWFNELQNLGITAEDGEGLRNIENYRLLRFAKKLNLTAGIIAAVVAIVGLIAVFFAFVAEKL